MTGHTSILSPIIQSLESVSMKLLRCKYIHTKKIKYELPFDHQMSWKNVDLLRRADLAGYKDWLLVLKYEGFVMYYFVIISEKSKCLT